MKITCTPFLGESHGVKHVGIDSHTISLHTSASHSRACLRPPCSETFRDNTICKYQTCHFPVPDIRMTLAIPRYPVHEIHKHKGK